MATSHSITGRGSALRPISDEWFPEVEIAGETTEEFNARNFDRDDTLLSALEPNRA
jgi:hypothetical protein